LSSALVRDRGPDLAIYCKGWRVRDTGGRYAKNQFSLDFARQLTCPAEAAMPFQPGRTARERPVVIACFVVAGIGEWQP
jgi:transposase